MSEGGAEVAVEDVAHHYCESGDSAHGMQWAERAADAACRVFAYDEALEMLGRARDCALSADRADGAARTGNLVRIDAALGDAAFARGDVTLDL